MDPNVIRALIGAKQDINMAPGMMAALPGVKPQVSPQIAALLAALLKPAPTPQMPQK